MGTPTRSSLTASYIAGVDGEVNFSLRGTLFGLGASAVGTFYTIYLKRYLSNVVDNSWLLTFYTNFNSCVILPFLCLVRLVSPLHSSSLAKFLSCGTTGRSSRLTTSPGFASVRLKGRREA